MKLRLGIILVLLALIIGGWSILSAKDTPQQASLATQTAQSSQAALTAAAQQPPSTSQEMPRSLPENAPTPPLPGSENGGAPTPASTITPLLTPTPIPSQSSDLLYLADNRLMRWDHVTQFATLLVENVVDYSLNPITRQVALLRPHGGAIHGELFDLDLLDFSTKQIVNLLQDTPRLYEMSFTSQGDRLIYIQRQDGERIFSLDLTRPGKPEQIAVCQKQGDITCDTVIVSPDGRSIAWQDAQGVWMVDDRNPQPRIIQTNQVVVTDPKGQKTQNPVIFDELGWSPDSRFILLKIIPSQSGVQWYGLLDTRKARLVDIPKSGDFNDQSAHIFWTNEGFLLLAHSNDPALDQPPFIQTWRIVPTANNVLSPEKFLYLGAEAAQISSLFPGGISLSPHWIHQLDEVFYGMAILNPSGAGPAHLYRLDMKKNILVQLMQIPEDTRQTLWAPDGSGALVISESGQVYFASMPGNRLVDLGATLGETAGDFTWLAPAPRN